MDTAPKELETELRKTQQLHAESQRLSETLREGEAEAKLRSPHRQPPGSAKIPTRGLPWKVSWRGTVGPWLGRGWQQPDMSATGEFPQSVGFGIAMCVPICGMH